MPHPRSSLLMILGLLLSIVAGPAPLAASPGDEKERPVTWALLSGNAGYDVPRIETGATYRAEPEPDNPGDDPANPRLQDGDRPHGDWNNTIGWSRKDATVTFDLKDRYRVAAVDLRLRSTDPNRMPQAVTVQWRAAEDEPWQAGPERELLPGELDGPWVNLRFAEPVAARYVRAVLTNQQGLNYLMEMRMWGTQAANTAAHVHAPPEDADARDGHVLVSDGKARGAIVIDPEAAKNVTTAARDLQSILERMTGVVVPMLADPAEQAKLPAGAMRLAVGPAMAERFEVSVPQVYDGGDHYRLTMRSGEARGGPVLVIAGNDSGERRGTNYAVFDLLRRLGCGWYGPDELWQVIPERPTLAIAPMDVHEHAAFDTYRNMRILGQFPGDEYRRLRDAWRNGGCHVKASHALGRRILPREKYVEEHPDWFGPKQVNLTHPGAIEQTVVELRKRIDESEGPRPLSIGIGALDSGGWASDERSRQVGNISAQYLYFANHVARGLRKTHGGQFQLVFYGYWFTHEPPKPMRAAEPEVVVMFVNQGNKAKSWLDPEPPEHRSSHGSNVRQKNHFLGWKQTGAEMAIYNWWIPGYGNDAWQKVPWYKGRAALENLRYWHHHGVRVLEFETMKRDERGDGFPIRWPLFYVATRAFWDLDRSADEILREACERLYQDAASSMFRYYKTLERALAETTQPVGNWNLPSPEQVYPPEVRAEAANYLEQAKEQATDPTVGRRVRAELATWREAVEVMRELEETEEQQTYELVVGDQTTVLDDPMVTVGKIRSLLGIPESKAVIAVEPDGQTRRADPAEEYDLRTGIRFRLADD